MQKKGIDALAWLAKVSGVCILLGGMELMFFSCATKPEAYGGIDASVSQGDFAGAVEAMKAGQEGKKPVYPESNAISYYLDKGLLEHYAGNNGDSALDLLEAERLIQEAYTKSITADMASYVANDNTKEYPGEDYEDIYLSIFNALNFYNNGDIEEALVEVRKLTMPNGKLDLLSQKYEGASKSAAAYLFEGLQKIGIQVSPDLPQGDPVNFSNSALARYLSVLFYLDEKNEDSARIEYEQLQAAFASNPNVYQNPIPKSVNGMNIVPEGKARLNIIGFTGLSPIKEEKVVTLPSVFGGEMNLKLPSLARRQGGISRAEAEVHGQGGIELELLEDISAVIIETFKARYSNILLKTFIRVLLKDAAVNAASDAAGKSPLGGLAQLGAKAGGKLAADASESADIRMGRFFPDKAFVGAIDLEPGTYDITVNLGGGVKEFKGVNVKAGKTNLLQAVQLK
jgi:hypothetical protein